MFEPHNYLGLKFRIGEVRYLVLDMKPLNNIHFVQIGPHYCSIVLSIIMTFFPSKMLVSVPKEKGKEPHDKFILRQLKNNFVSFTLLSSQFFSCSRKPYCQPWFSSSFLMQYISLDN